MVEGGPEFNPEEETEEESFPISREQRNVTLRHAVGYLEDKDTSALMKEREDRQGVRAVMGRIGDRLRAGPLRRGIVMGSEDNERLKAIQEAVNDAYSGSEKLKEAHGEGTADIKNQKIDRDKIQLLTRFKEAMRLSDEAVKLIRELPFVDEVREAEIEQQLDSFHEQLMTLAHKDSYKILYEYEENITRKERPSDRSHLGLKSNRDFYQRPEETLNDYHDRIRPQQVTRQLKDTRVLYDGAPTPDSDSELKTGKDESGFSPDMGKTRRVVESAELKNVRPQLVTEAEYQAWADKHIDAEKKGFYKTRLEGPYTETVHALGDEGNRDEVEELYNFINELSADKKGRLSEILNESHILDSLRAEKVSVEVKEVPRTETFTYTNPEARRGGGGTVRVDVENDKEITINLGEGRYHVLTIFFDGFIDRSKGSGEKSIVKLPPSADPEINYSLRHTMFRRMSEEKPISLNQSTRIIINPNENIINDSDNILNILKEGTVGLTEEIKGEIEEKESLEEDKKREREDVGRSIADFSKQLISLGRKIPQDTVSTPLIHSLVQSATNIREKYSDALESDYPAGFIGLLNICQKETKTISQLLDTISDTYGHDPSFHAHTELTNSTQNSESFKQIFQDLLEEAK